MKVNPVINLSDVELRDFGNGEDFISKVGSFGDMIGSIDIGCMLHVVPPGKKAFPFHVHHKNPEIFIILEGDGTYRFGSERYKIKAGDVCAAPAGGIELAHQIINTGDVELRYLGLSGKDKTEVVEYPDSNKFAVMSRFDWHNPASGGLRFIGRSDSSIDYFDGEK